MKTSVDGYLESFSGSKVLIVGDGPELLLGSVDSWAVLYLRPRPSNDFVTASSKSKPTTRARRSEKFDLLFKPPSVSVRSPGQGCLQRHAFIG